MFKKSDFSGVGGSITLSIICFFLLLTGFMELIAYPWDIPRDYEFKGVRYNVTPLMYFIVCLLVFLAAAVPTSQAIMHRYRIRIAEEIKEAEKSALEAEKMPQEQGANPNSQSLTDIQSNEQTNFFATSLMIGLGLFLLFFFLIFLSEMLSYFAKLLT